MKKVHITLSNANKEKFILEFELLKNSFVEKWIECVCEAKAKGYKISEPWAIYNLNDSMDKNFILKNLNRLITEVDEIEPLFNFKLNDIKDQQALNHIHAVFEKHHGKLDEWKNNHFFADKPETFRKNLSEINQFVHACESINTGLPKIRITYFDLPKFKKFNDNDYELFTNKKNFGSLYHLYCDVGKNIESLARDNDTDHHDVVPNIHYSADCVVFFADNTEADVKKLVDYQKQYIANNKDYLKTQGYAHDSKELTTGKIELAKLVNITSRQDLLQKLKKYDTIKNLELE